MVYDMMERSSRRRDYWSLSMRVDVARRAVERLAARARTSILRTNPWSTATRQPRARHSPPGLVRDRLRAPDEAQRCWALAQRPAAERPRFTCRHHAAKLKRDRSEWLRGGGRVRAPVRLSHRPPSFHHLTDLLDAVGCRPKMNDGVAVRTHGPKIHDRVNAVIGIYAGELAKVVDMDRISCDGPVSLGERHPACGALQTVVFQADSTCFRVALIGVHRDSTNRAFGEKAGTNRLFAAACPRCSLMWIMRTISTRP